MVALALDATPATVTAPAGLRFRLQRQLLVVVGVSVLLGAATSFAQTFLPDALRPFSNSASGWTALTAGMVAACRARTKWSALLGVTSFAALVVGYQLMSTLRGFPTNEIVFLVVGLAVGPFVGVAASWLARAGVRAALGCAVLSGIALGEGVYGLVLVSGSTGWFSWTLISVAGLATLAMTAIRGRRRPRVPLLAIVSTGLVALVFFFGYTAIGQLAG